MQSSSQRRVGVAGQGASVEESRLLKNGAPAHAFTTDDRARGGHARAEKIRRRKELRERLGVAELEDLATNEPDFLDQALARLTLLIASEDDRVALRAVKEVLDRTLGRPTERQEHGRSPGPDLEAAAARARRKLAALIERRSAPSATTGEQQ
jgi:hypothetical protein